MKANPLIIFIIIMISAGVFGGVIFFGLPSSIAPAAPSSFISDGTTSRIPDILNLLGSGNNQTQPQGREDARGGARETTSENIVVESTELVAPALPVDSLLSQQLRQSNKITPQSPSSNGVVISPVLPLASSESSQATNSLALPFVPKQPNQAQAAIIAGFSVFNVSPQLRDFRAQMVKEGVIQETEFVKINNNSDMEQFLVKLVEWKGKEASSTAAQIQDARDRIIKAYDQIGR